MMKNTHFVFNRKSITIISIMSVLILLFLVTPSADAYFGIGLAGKWDRLNPDPSNPTPEHEVLGCGGTDRLFCIYDKWPAPLLGFETPPDATYGVFLGREIASWDCPYWFPGKICDNTTFVAGGVMRYYLPDGSRFSVDQDLIVTEMDGQQVLYMYWVDSLVCPWYRSFREALAANPFPLPFDGENWPAIDWIFVP
jgi:hypothetical protein